MKIIEKPELMNLDWLVKDALYLITNRANDIINISNIETEIEKMVKKNGCIDVKQILKSIFPEDMVKEFEKLIFGQDCKKKPQCW